MVQPIGLPAGLIFDVVYNPTLVRLTVVPGMNLPGDYNFDGIVDAADYVVWRKNDGTQGGYNAWRANYGRAAASGTNVSIAGQTAVPEPAALMLICVAAIARLFCRVRAI